MGWMEEQGALAGMSTRGDVEPSLDERPVSSRCLTQGDQKSDTATPIFSPRGRHTIMLAGTPHNSYPTR
jgi:hypothetical protein